MHNSAAGCCVHKDHTQYLVDALNKRYAGIDQTPVYWVDYIWDAKDIKIDDILELAGLDIFGQGMPETKVAIENIKLDESNVILMSRDRNPTIKIKCGALDLIKFKSSEEEFADFISGNKTLTCVGKPAINNWQGEISGQVLIDDFVLKKAEEEELSWEDF